MSYFFRRRISRNFGITRTGWGGQKARRRHPLSAVDKEHFFPGFEGRFKGGAGEQENRSGCYL